MKRRRRLSEMTAEQRLKHRTRSRSASLQKQGILVKQPCRRCGDQNSEKHHPDYNDAINIVWICRKCHRGEHGNLPIQPPREMASELRCRLESSTLSKRKLAEIVFWISAATLAQVADGMPATPRMIEKIRRGLWQLNWLDKEDRKRVLMANRQRVRRNRERAEREALL